MLNKLSPFSRNVWLTMALFVVLALAFAVYAWSEKQIDRANDLRHQSFLLADELRQSSDDLTKMARTYVVTGDPAYKKHYQDILDIRNGRKPRPDGYQHIYWDLVLADGQPPRPDSGQAIALLELMRQAGFTAQEFSKLAEAKANSDDLTATEFEAMKLVEAAGPQADASHARARMMMFDDKYHQAKAAIMKPINEFYKLMDKRTGDAVLASETNATILRDIFIAFGLSLMLILVRTHKALRTIMGGPVDEVYAHITRIGSGDFTSAILVADGTENSVLGRLAETQINLNKIDSKRKQAEEAQQEALDHLQKIASRVPGVVYQFLLRPDGSSCFPFASEAIREIYRVSPEDVREDASKVFAILHPEDYDGIGASIRESARDLTPWRYEYRVKFDDGTVRWLFGNALPQREKDGAVLWDGFITDITDHKQAEEEIKHLAFYDALTQLPNRRLMQDRLQQAMATSARSGKYGALLFIDLDHFKTLNDTLGHDIGDLLLQQVAQRLVTCVREGDTVARLGGDEFVVMLEDLSENPQEAAAQTEAIGEKIIFALNQTYQLGSHESRSTPSIGATLFSAHQETVDELLKRADIAMYQAKAAGRNTLRFYDPEMQAIVTARVIMDADLRRALAESQFDLYYQAQVNHAGRILGAEVLIRWRHPKRGLILPLEFIPLAEENGLILPIGQWVLESTCAQLKAWENNLRTQHLQLAVNVSARQFRQPDFVAQVRQALQSCAINPARLKLELTESLVLDNIDDTIARMQSLKEIGVRFSMDDFGTGYSSLSYLTQLPLHQLKIDQSFVRNIGVKTTDAVIVQTIIGMAHNLGIEVIAEGVETEAQRAFLEQLSCLFCQGYLFGRPMPLGEFEQLLGND